MARKPEPRQVKDARKRVAEASATVRVFETRVSTGQAEEQGYYRKIADKRREMAELGSSDTAKLEAELSKLTDKLERRRQKNSSDKAQLEVTRAFERELNEALQDALAAADEELHRDLTERARKGTAGIRKTLELLIAQVDGHRSLNEQRLATRTSHRKHRRGTGPNLPGGQIPIPGGAVVAQFVDEIRGHIR